MTPTASAVHVNRPLTQIAIGFMQNAAGFIADKVFPNIPVAKQSDLYFKYDRSDWMRNQFEKRAPGTESAGSGWKTSTDSYFAHVWALHKDIADQIRSNQDDPINMDRDATLWLAEQAMISREVQWAAAFFTTGVWMGVTGAAQDIAGVASDTPSTHQVEQWDREGSTPVTNIKAYADTMWALTGYRPNKLVLGRQVWTKLSEHDDLVGRIQYGSNNQQPAIVSRQAAAALFEVGEILVADGLQVTSKENPTFETSMTIAPIIGKGALLLYAAPAPSILQPSGGYTFSWNTYLPGQSDRGAVISTFRMQHLKSDRVEGEMAFAQKLVSPECGVYFTTLVA